MGQVLVNILAVTGTVAIVVFTIVLILLAVGAMRLYFSWIRDKIGYKGETLADRFVRYWNEIRRKKGDSK